jgi:hypothetical protein
MLRLRRVETPHERSPLPSDLRFFCTIRFCRVCDLIQDPLGGNTSRRLMAVLRTRRPSFDARQSWNQEEKTVTTYAPDSFEALHIRFMSLLSRE